MTLPIRPVKTFVLRLWREPGDQETEVAWRGLIRPLRAEAATTPNEQEVPFHGLENLVEALRPLLTVEKTERTPDTRQHPPASAPTG